MRRPVGYSSSLFAVCLLAAGALACDRGAEGPTGPGADVGGPPSAPTHLYARAISPTWVRLQWQDRSNDETGFRIYRGTSADDASTLAATPASGREGFDDLGLEPGTTYHYRVFSYNEYGESEFDTYAVVSTPVEAVPTIVVSDRAPVIDGIINAPDPDPTIVQITNGTTEAAADLRVIVDYDSGTGWLNAELRGPTAPTEMILAVDADELAAGRYHASVTLTSSTATNSPLVVSVTLDVSYEFIELPGLGGERSEARDINNRGKIVGWSETPDGRRHAVLWDNGTAIDLGTLGYDRSEAWAINDMGQVVGVAGSGTVFVWDEAGMRSVGSLRSSGPMDINDRGDIVAENWLRSLGPDSAVTFLGSLGGGRTYAHAVNEFRKVVGYSTTQDDKWHAFTWCGGTIHDLGTLDGRYSVAEDVNDSGQVVGWSGGRAVAWYDGQTTELETPPGHGSYAVSINSAGDVVGWVDDYSTHRTHAFVWRNHRSVRLQPGGTYAWSTNEAGEVVGSYQRTFDLMTAVLWRPVQ